MLLRVSAPDVNTPALGSFLLLPQPQHSRAGGGGSLWTDLLWGGSQEMELDRKGPNSPSQGSSLCWVAAGGSLEKLSG